MCSLHSAFGRNQPLLTIDLYRKSLTLLRYLGSGPSLESLPPAAAALSKASMMAVAVAEDRLVSLALDSGSAKELDLELLRRAGSILLLHLELQLGAPDGVGLGGLNVGRLCLAQPLRLLHGELRIGSRNLRLAVHVEGELHLSETLAGTLQRVGMSSARETLIRMPSCGSLRSLTSMQRHFRLFAVTCFSPEQQSGVGDGASPCTYCMHVDSPNS
ncbi:hypothetical protein ZIOFF_008518 [Zingiber officinale]|uniref:Uncharacterized protein n=1 Tax=Zingiber officinale TaxID=94328 RepID=A0A8J5IFP8_ZINOF|nr:hypothetical protein ZIOFF_008518 [Zingiber officinale]